MPLKLGCRLVWHVTWSLVEVIDSLNDVLKTSEWTSFSLTNTKHLRVYFLLWKIITSLLNNIILSYLTFKSDPTFCSIFYSKKYTVPGKHNVTANCISQQFQAAGSIPVCTSVKPKPSYLLLVPFNRLISFVIDTTLNS